METWPSSLTGFTDDFSIQPNTVAEKNMTDGGVNHAFSRWTSDIVEISGKLHYGQDDLATFKTFYRDTIKNGTEAFYLTDFPIFGDYETHEVVFKEHPDISYAAWMEWDVSVTLLSSDLGYMTEAAMTALLPEEPDDDYVTFPASVFGEVTDDFGWQQDDLIARGNTDGGDFPFTKRFSHVSSTTAQWGIEVSRANMNLFYAWGLYKLAGFKKWFKVELPYGGTTQTVTARFSEPPKASFKGRGDADEGLWTISGELEIYEVNYWALADCDSLPELIPEPVLLSQPYDVICKVGDSIRLFASAKGDDRLLYSWYLFGELVHQSYSNDYEFQVTTTNFGTYYCVVSNVYGSVQTNNCYVYVAPYITVQPEWTTTETSATIDITVIGSGEVTYALYKSDVLVEGATSHTYTIDSIENDDAGDYRFVITSTYGTVTSDWATLIVGYFMNVMEVVSAAAGLHLADADGAVWADALTETVDGIATFGLADTDGGVYADPLTETLDGTLVFALVDEESVT